MRWDANANELAHIARVRFATLLLALVFTSGALAPCGLARAAAFPNAGHRHAHHALQAGAAPCHDSAAGVVRAPCPCGCEKRAPRGASLGSLGVALLAGANEISAPLGRDANPIRHADGFASPALARLEKVPRTL